MNSLPILCPPAFHLSAMAISLDPVLRLFARNQLSFLTQLLCSFLHCSQTTPPVVLCCRQSLSLSTIFLPSIIISISRLENLLFWAFLQSSWSLYDCDTGTQISQIHFFRKDFGNDYLLVFVNEHGSQRQRETKQARVFYVSESGLVSYLLSASFWSEFLVVGVITFCLRYCSTALLSRMLKCRLWPACANYHVSRVFN